MKKAVLLLTAALLAVQPAPSIGQTSGQSPIAAMFQNLMQSYSEIQHATEGARSVKEKGETVIATFEKFQAAFDRGALGADTSSLRAEYAVDPQAFPFPAPPDVSVDMNSAASLNATLTSLDTYSQVLLKRQEVIQAALTDAHVNLDALNTLYNESLQAGDRTEALLNYFSSDPAGVAIMSWIEGHGEFSPITALSNQLGDIAQIRAAIEQLQANWQAEVNRLQALLDQSLAALHDLSDQEFRLRSRLADLEIEENHKRQAEEQRNREQRLSALNGLPSTFQGVATDNTFTTRYAGNRAGPAVQGLYSGSEGTGAFSGVIDRSLQVRGQYVDVDGEKGTFQGVATPKLDRVFGNIECTSNC